MKLIKDGKITTPNREGYYVCDLCGAIMELDREDAETYIFDDPIPGVYLTCLYCNRNTYLRKLAAGIGC